MASKAESGQHFDDIELASAVDHQNEEKLHLTAQPEMDKAEEQSSATDQHTHETRQQQREVVTRQPGDVRHPKIPWMPAPPRPENCPLRMQYLCPLDELHIEQIPNPWETEKGWECKNKFKISNTQGEQVYWSRESSHYCQRMWCGRERGLVFHIADSSGYDVFLVRRDFQCCKGSFLCPLDCCRYTAKVEDWTGNTLGFVGSLHPGCVARFGLYDPHEKLIAEVRPPCCPCQSICSTEDVDIPILDTASGSELGRITKQWAGCLNETCTDADRFKITFPVDTDVKMKALMTGAVFIVDMMLYEKSGNAMLKGCFSVCGL